MEHGGGHLKAQLRSAGGRNSKVIKDRERIEAVVEVLGAGRLVLCVDSGGGYSLRGWPEEDEASAQDLLSVGVIRPEGIVSLRPEGVHAASVSPAEQGAPLARFCSTLLRRYLETSLALASRLTVSLILRALPRARGRPRFCHWVAAPAAHGEDAYSRMIEASRRTGGSGRSSRR